MMDEVPAIRVPHPGSLGLQRFWSACAGLRLERASPLGWETTRRF